MSKYLVCGAGGFIGGHLVKRLMEQDHEVVCADFKPLEYWYQIFEKNKNYSLDLKEYENCLLVSKGIDYVYNMACNMGGMGFIENNKAECMLSVLINTNMLRSCLKNNIKKYFFSSSACVYNAQKQKNTFVPGLKEEDAYPAEPEDGYGWEKLFSERMCRHFSEDFGLDTRVVRYHNVYGPLGTYDGGREKAPAAICRKIINAKLNNIDAIDVWGDGKQTRSFAYITDTIKGIIKAATTKKAINETINIGNTKETTIIELGKIIKKLTNSNSKITYKPLPTDDPKRRSPDIRKAKEILGWTPEVNLETGLQKTINWFKTKKERS